MSPVFVLLLAIGAYLAIGLVVALWFVLVGIRRADPVAAGASLRVRMLFLPGTVGVWPLVLARARARACNTGKESA